MAEKLTASSQCVVAQPLTVVQGNPHIIVLVSGTTDPFNSDKKSASRSKDDNGAQAENGKKKDSCYWSMNSEFLSAIGVAGKQFKSQFKGVLPTQFDGKEFKRELKEFDRCHVGADGKDHLEFYDEFEWNGNNTIEDRIQAGKDLVEKLITKYKHYDEDRVYFHLIGHSHGGNVINEFTRAINERTDWNKNWKIKSITYLSTPFFTSIHKPVVNKKVFWDNAEILSVSNQYDLTQRFIADFSLDETVFAFECLANKLSEYFALEDIDRNDAKRREEIRSTQIKIDECCNRIPDAATASRLRLLYNMHLENYNKEYYTRRSQLKRDWNKLSAIVSKWRIKAGHAPLSRSDFLFPIAVPIKVLASVHISFDYDDGVKITVALISILRRISHMLDSSNAESLPNWIKTIGEHIIGGDESARPMIQPKTLNQMLSAFRNISAELAESAQRLETKLSSFLFGRSIPAATIIVELKLDSLIKLLYIEPDMLENKGLFAFMSNPPKDIPEDCVWSMLVKILSNIIQQYDDTTADPTGLYEDNPHIVVKKYSVSELDPYSRTDNDGNFDDFMNMLKEMEKKYARFYTELKKDNINKNTAIRLRQEIDRILLDMIFTIVANIGFATKINDVSDVVDYASALKESLQPNYQAEESFRQEELIRQNGGRPILINPPKDPNEVKRDFVSILDSFDALLDNLDDIIDERNCDLMSDRDDEDAASGIDNYNMFSPISYFAIVSHSISRSVLLSRVLEFLKKETVFGESASKNSAFSKYWNTPW